MTVFITGINGYLGSNLAKTLVNDCNEVHGLVRDDSNLERLVDIQSRIHFHKIGKIETSPKTMIHTATCYGRHGESENEIKQACFDLPLTLITEFKELNHFINIDTVLDEKTNPYAFHKKRLREKLEELPLTVSNLVLDQFYGPNDGTFFSFVIQQLQQDTPAIDLTKGEQLRHFLYISDVVNAINYLLAAPSQSGFTNYEAAGNKVTLKAMVLEIKNQLGNTETHLNWGAKPYRSTELMDSSLNSTSLKALGWVPEHDYVSGICKTLANYIPTPSSR